MKLLPISIVLLFTSGTIGYGQSLRPVSFVRYNQGSLHDSAHYSYSGGRGGEVRFTGVGNENNHLLELYTVGQLDAGYINADITDQTFPTAITPHRIRVINSYNILSNIISTQVQSGNTSATLQDQSLVTLTGLGTHVITELTSTWDIVSASWLPANRLVRTYNSTGKLTDQLTQIYSGGTWTNFSRGIYTLNSMSQLQSYTFAYWQNSSSVWGDTFRSSYYYSPTGVLDSFTRSSKQTSWWNTNTYRFQYNTLHEAITMERLAGNAVVERDSNIYDALHRRILIYTTHIGLSPLILKPHSLTTITYTGNQLKRVDYKSLDSSANPPDYFEEYEYETYAPTSVELSTLKDDIRIYPVPANDRVYIEGHLKKTGPVQCKIIDVTGRLVQRWDLAPTDHFATSIPTQTFVAGRYIIQIRTEDQLLSRPMIIARYLFCLRAIIPRCHS